VLAHEIPPYELNPRLLAADCNAADGDPLKDITAVRRVVFVMKRGKVFENLARGSKTPKATRRASGMPNEKVFLAPNDAPSSANEDLIESEPASRQGLSRPYFQRCF
jgi:hypothetical protein